MKRSVAEMTPEPPAGVMDVLIHGLALFRFTWTTVVRALFDAATVPVFVAEV
jgi:hypothetical protein